MYRSISYVTHTYLMHFTMQVDGCIVYSAAEKCAFLPSLQEIKT